MMTKKRIYATILLMAVISFAGFFTENLFTSFTIGNITNKNMVLPFLFGYGLGMAGMYLIFGTPDEPKLGTKKLKFKNKAAGYLYYFVVSFICVSIGEIILGYTIEFTCDIIWWDYTSLPLSFTRYTSLPTSTGFGILITLLMKFVYIPLRERFEKADTRITAPIAVILAILLSLDMLNSSLYMLTQNDTLQIWEITFRSFHRAMLG